MDAALTKLAEVVDKFASTRFGLTCVSILALWKTAESQPDIAQYCMIGIVVVTLAHIASRTFKPGNGHETPK